MCIHDEDPHSTHKGNPSGTKHNIINFEFPILDHSSLPEKTIGDRFKKQRLLKGLNIKELARLSGVSENTISSLERDLRTPNISTVYSLNTILKLEFSYIYNTKEWPEKTNGHIIKKYRHNLGLSINDLAKLCNLNKSTIQDYENNKLNESNTLTNILNVLNYK